MIITAGGHRGHRPLSEEVFVCSAGLTIREVDKIEVTVDRLGEDHFHNSLESLVRP